MSNSNKPIPLPAKYTDGVDVNIGMPDILQTIKRAADQMFAFDRGTMVYDGIDDCYIMHMQFDEADRKVAPAFLKGATDIWLVVDAHTLDNSDYYVEGEVMI